MEFSTGDILCLRATDADRRRFWRHVDEHGDCWLYRSTHKVTGYGQFSIKHHTVLAHRFSLLQADAMRAHGIVRHICRAKACVRPSHLQWGTHAQNSSDDRRRDGTLALPSRQGERHPMSRLSKQQVADIWHAYRRGIETTYAIAARHGIQHQTVSKIAHGVRWAAFTRTLR